MSFAEDEGYDGYDLDEMWHGKDVINDEFKRIFGVRKMQITGRIINVVPTERGGYTTQQGKYIFTYNMSIQGQSGRVKTGEIGSTSNPYPMSPGETITVDVEETQYGPKFKKVKDQPRNEDPKSVEGKCICQVVCAGISSGQLPCKNDVDIKHWVDLMLGREALNPQTNYPGPDKGFSPNVEQTDMPEDEIPF